MIPGSLYDVKFVMSRQIPRAIARQTTGLISITNTIRPSNMTRMLPFTALRTLEAVVRLNGFGRAAEELNVTQSAVSQHVKALEEWTGHRLLIRGARRTVPTEAGLRLSAAVAEGFGTVQRVCDALRDEMSPRNRGVTVAAPPGFAFVWLLPRLIGFDELHPNTPVSLSTDVSARDSQAELADVMILYGTGDYPGLHAEKLLGEVMTPVCAAPIRESLRDVSDLSRQTLLHDDLQMGGLPSTWHYWADRTGLDLPAPRNQRRFGQANLVVQAAIQGLGVAMGRSTLVSDAILEERLFCPFPQVAPSPLSYWLVCKPDALAIRQVALFRDWLHDAVSRQKQPAIFTGT